MTDELRCCYCRRRKSRSRKPFTIATLAQHEAVCKWQNYYFPGEQERNEEFSVPVPGDPDYQDPRYDHIDPDESDGVYWAMVAEENGELE